MDESQAVAHALFVENLQRLEQFRRGEAEFRGVAAAVFPFSGARRGQLNANAEVGHHAELFGGAGDDVELVELLHDDENTLAHLLREQRQLDVRLVFIAVADDERVALALHGDDGVQLGLRAGLESEVELASVRDDFLDHGLRLVHLHGIDDEILALIVVFLARFFEAARRLFDTAVENVGKAQQHGRRDIAQRQFVDDFAQVDLRLVLAGCHIDVSRLIDTEIRDSPTVQVVEFLRVFNRPFFHIRRKIFKALVK